jgi:hypothetical protein
VRKADNLPPSCAVVTKSANLKFLEPSWPVQVYNATDTPFFTLIGNDNSVEKEIQRPILAGNRTYFEAISLFRSRLLSRATKIILYKTLTRPVMSCGAEAWTLTEKEEQAVLIF